MANNKQSGRSCKRAKAMILIRCIQRIKTPSPQGEGACRFYLWAPALPLRRRALNVAAPKEQIVTSPAGSGTAVAGPVVTYWTIPSVNPPSPAMPNLNVRS